MSDEHSVEWIAVNVWEFLDNSYMRKRYGEDGQVMRLDVPNQIVNCLTRNQKFAETDFDRGFPDRRDTDVYVIPKVFNQVNKRNGKPAVLINGPKERVSRSSFTRRIHWERPALR